MNDKGVYRTALATPARLITVVLVGHPRLHRVCQLFFQQIKIKVRIRRGQMISLSLKLFTLLYLSCFKDL